MKKILALILALTMVFALAACGETEPTTETTEPTQPATDFVPQEAEWENGKITVVGAEAIKDSDDKDGIRIYYDYENTTDETVTASENLDIVVMQDEYEAEEVYTWDDAPEYGNDSRRLRPGAAIRCCAEYSMKATGGEVVVNFFDYWSEDGIGSVTFDPAALPGRPAKELEIKPVADPVWTSDLSDEGIVDEDDGYYVVIDSAETLKDDDGNDAVRIYFQFTNGGADATSMWFGTTVAVYQDGVELEEASVFDDPAEGVGFYDDVAPGETSVVSNEYVLRSDSPVEVEVLDTWGEGGIGCVFS